LIKYSLRCAAGHEFEGWFRNSAAYDEQTGSHSLSCPVCGVTDVQKAPMAPQIMKRAEVTRPKPPPEVINAIRELRTAVISQSEDVGEKFAEEARKMHYDEAPARSIRGQASIAEATELREEGIEVMLLPPLPEDLN